MILYFDTETTGLRPGYICQLSYVMQDSFGAIGKNFFFTVPEVEYSAYLVHGFSIQKLFELSGGKTFSDYVDEIAADFNYADVIIAHNAAFDINFMRTEFERVGKIFKYRAEFDTMKKSVALCKLSRSGGRSYKYPKLTELCDFFGVSFAVITECERTTFGSVSKNHDARFDTSAMYLCVQEGMNKGYAEFDLKEFI